MWLRSITDLAGARSPGQPSTRSEDPTARSAGKPNATLDAAGADWESHVNSVEKINRDFARTDLGERLAGKVSDQLELFADQMRQGLSAPSASIGLTVMGDSFAQVDLLA